MIYDALHPQFITANETRSPSLADLQLKTKLNKNFSSIEESLHGLEANRLYRHIIASQRIIAAYGQAEDSIKPSSRLFADTT